MGPLRAVVIQEQNPGRLSGVQTDTSVFATSSFGPTLRSGREPPTYILAGTQTASLVQVILDLANAAGGDSMTVKRYSTAVIGTGASQIQVVSGSAAGAVVGAIQNGTAAVNSVTAVFDGVNQIWK